MVSTGKATLNAVRCKNLTTDGDTGTLSLVDVIAFGVFPAVLCYHMGQGRILGIVCLFLYVLCAVIRLAFFNVVEEQRQKKEYESKV